MADTPPTSDATGQHPTEVAGALPRRTGRLALEDGTIYPGIAFGAQGVFAEAEVVFNTAMTGYQESMTDPSYAGQILVETFPMVGIVGVNGQDVESDRVQISGLVVRELVPEPSNYRALGSLGAYLADAGVMGLAGVDTRALTLRLREVGAMRGVLTDDSSIPDPELVARAQAAASMAGRNLVGTVGSALESSWEQTLGEWGAPSPSPEPGQGDSPIVWAIDCGVKLNILRHLRGAGCEVRVVPHTIRASGIVEAFEQGRCDGLLISNGPGDPAGVEGVVSMLAELLRDQRARPLPVLGICLGHQLLALAAGGKTVKMKFGHRGVNQPVLDRERGVVEITSQNHGFAVEASFPTESGVVITHEHLNDGSVAGLRLSDRPVMSVQHHPEASPGPHEASSVFGRFVQLVRARRHHGVASR